MFGPKKYELFSFGTNVFFWNPYFFPTQCLARKNEISFLLEPFFFGRMFGLNMYEITIFSGTLCFLNCNVLMK